MSENEPSSEQAQNKVAGFFQEDNGSSSSIRLMSFISLFAAILFGYLTLHIQDASGNGILITFGFLVGAFAPKVVQKFAEAKISPSRPK